MPLGQSRRPKKFVNPLERKKLPHSIWLGQVKPPEHEWIDPEVPRLLLGSSLKDPLERMKEVEDELNLQIKPRMDILKEIPKRVFGAPSYRKREQIRKQKKRVKDFLLEKKYIIETSGNDLYTVYVINLSDEVGPRENQNRWVYVGQTKYTPKERLEQHLAGIRSSNSVERYGERLNYGLFRDIPKVRFRQDAEMLERRLAKDLQSRGFNVKGGH